MLGKLLDACIWLDDDLMTTYFKLAEHAQLIIFARSPEKKWVHENVSFRSVYNGQLRLCMSLLCVWYQACCRPDKNHSQQVCWNKLEQTSGVTIMGSDRENPGAPNLNGPLYVTMSFSDQQNSVKSLPKVQEMAFQRF
jgi:hypothetical protein